IQDEFKKNPRKLNFRKAVATNFEQKDKYLCYIPGDNSVIFVLDYAEMEKGMRQAWYIWDGIDAAGGILATANDELFVSSKGTPTLWKQKFTGTKYDFSNHTSAIDFEYITSFLNYSKPIIDKYFHKLWINSIEGGFS